MRKEVSVRKKTRLHEQMHLCHIPPFHYAFKAPSTERRSRYMQGAPEQIICCLPSYNQRLRAGTIAPTSVLLVVEQVLKYVFLIAEFVAQTPTPQLCHENTPLSPRLCVCTPLLHLTPPFKSLCRPPALRKHTQEFCKRGASLDGEPTRECVKADPKFAISKQIQNSKILQKYFQSQRMRQKPPLVVYIKRRRRVDVKIRAGFQCVKARRAGDAADRPTE